LAGTVLVVAGAGSLLGAGVGLLDSLEGEVPVLGVVGVELYLDVGSAATATAGAASASASTAARRLSQRDMPGDPFLIGNAALVRDLLEAMTSVRVMPTSRWWCDERLGPLGTFLGAAATVPMGKRILSPSPFSRTALHLNWRSIS